MNNFDSRAEGNWLGEGSAEQTLKLLALVLVALAAYGGLVK